MRYVICDMRCLNSEQFSGIPEKSGSPLRSDRDQGSGIRNSASRISHPESLMKSLSVFSVLLFIVSFSGESSLAQSLWDNLKDSEDGAFDMSQFLSSRVGFLPVVIPITEPAVGIGLAGGVAYFHEQTTQPVAEGGRMVPPSLSALGGLYTSNKSWAIGGGHRGVWNQNRIHYIGGLGYGSINLKYYGRYNQFADDPRDYNIKVLGLLQEISFRLGNTDVFLGVSYLFLLAHVRFDLDDRLPQRIISDENDAKTGGLGLVVQFDGHDNFFTPNRGVAAKLTASRYDTFFGGDFGYWKFDLYGTGYWQALKQLVLGLRLAGSAAGEDTPFWHLPFIQMRGIPAMRYLGEFVALAETEARWDFSRRWSLIGFFGAGKTASTVKEYATTKSGASGGAGIRYLLARKFGLRAGIDVARGPEDWAFYIIIGNAWLRP
ncbi:MAG: BamA/TamA family outer membrane protein [Desulfobacteraceae bacterium]|nr:BamA/TamA family outer membrane protein [Desulfobacteraceae bacterium]